ncbi:MAG: sodium:calcium antiporter [Gammaproteobacteria bacterium]|nr:sodium:calcium antiporter [Gammaproteobacteria bacterium]
MAGCSRNGCPDRVNWNATNVFRRASPRRSAAVSIAAGLIAMLLVILAAAAIFTNAREHLGERLKISEGVTGSIFAAVGTAMPESIVPLVAILAGTDDAHVNAEIGIGAILGAPLMLATLAPSLMAIAVYGHRGADGFLMPERSGLRRDLHFFLICFSVSLLAMFIPHQQAPVRLALVIGLVLTYFLYILLTVRVSAKLVADGHGTEAHQELFLCRAGLPDTWPVLGLQLLGGLILLVAGAKGFVHSVSSAAHTFGLSPLLLSLLVIPIATELPEKVNSILWIRRRKDTLAFGNITGAMVFQGSLLPAIGIALTPWTPNLTVLSGVIVTCLAAAWLTVLAHRGRLRVWHLFVNGGLYLAYLVVVLL